MLLDRFVDRRLRADPIEADVHADPIQPCAERRLAFEVAKSAEGAKEDVLRQVARVFVIADETIAELINSTAMTLDDEVECARMSSQGCGHQFRFTQIRQ